MTGGGSDWLGPLWLGGNRVDVLLPAADPLQDVGAVLRGSAEQLQHAAGLLQVQTVHQGTRRRLNPEQTGHHSSSSTSATQAAQRQILLYVLLII